MKSVLNYLDVKMETAVTRLNAVVTRVGKEWIVIKVHCNFLDDYFLQDLEILIW